MIRHFACSYTAIGDKINWTLMEPLLSFFSIFFQFPRGANTISSKVVMPSL